MDTLVACSTCGLVHQATLDATGAIECSRCGWVLRAEHKPNSLARTAAFSIAALTFYWPANAYPILSMTRYGVHSENTVLGGCVRLFRDGQWLVAGVVFLASIVIPLCKLLALLFLVTTAKRRSPLWRRERTWVYKAVHVMGPWAMLDVFLLSVLVALVKLKQLATVMPGPGLLAFTLVVIFTLLASASFDPHAIWATDEPAESAP
ncbi:MAG: paraquat-inducible protein A [Acidobacteriota bacterium]